VTTTSSPQPPIGKPLADQTWKQGKAVNYGVPAGAFLDPQHETLTYSATLGDGSDLPSWLKFNAKTRSFTGIPPAGDDFAVTVTATDTDGQSTSETFNITMIDAPVVASGTAVLPQVWTSGMTINITLPDGTFSDPQGQALTYSAKLSSGALLPSWLHVDKTSGELTGTVPATVTNMTIVEYATDTSGLSASTSFTVAGVRPPIVSQHQGNQTLPQGKTLHMSLANEFVDPQHQALTYTVTQQDGSALPSWLVFDTTKDALSGVAPGISSKIAILVTAANNTGLIAVDKFTITTVAAPVLNDQTAAQTFLVGASNSFSLASDTFTDPNGQHLSYTASLANGAALPTWLHFNPVTETFSGTPKVGNLTLGAIEALPAQQWASLDPKPISLMVTAHDSGGMTAHETFTLNFTNVPLVGV